MATITPTKNDQLLEQQNTRESNARSYPRRLPMAIEKAEGIYLTDMDGKTYIDFLAGAGTLALGHNHPAVLEEMEKVLKNKSPLHTLDFTTPIKEQFVDEIFEWLPEEFRKNAKIQFCGPTGGDAIEAALKLVKTATGNSGILSFQGAYHGATHATMSISGNTKPKEKVQGLMPDVQFLPYPYQYRCPFGIGGEDSHKISSQYIENLLNDPESGLLAPAGMILEAVQGEGGSIPAPIPWLKEIRRITKEKGIPLIIDEVQSGIGRTGKMFAFEHAGIIPDVLVLSKAIGGSLPLSVVIYHKDLDVWTPGAHIGTFRGNQLAMAAGTASLKYMKQTNLIEHAAKMGELLQDILKDLQKDIPQIGDVRGRGLMVGVEMVDHQKEQNQNGSYPAHSELASAIQQECFERGLILEVGGRHGSVVRFLPPLIVTEAQLREATEIFEQAVRAAVARG
ncbi:MULTISPECIES: aspartate aminotransferase family protein [Bacillaceae]|uniref:Diaminobutyrate--2-oxoglutarate transaminase n=1 Tax=Peribacillus simplex TaxID=1478 RepID=A0A120GQB0_9BACI|nr:MULTISPECIES: aspartate aminotransferase family protein [Bacillaceae]KWW21059.1 2,4-diaminobutyrate 4-aminotransferase [Peribacillus simplex]PJN88213.1 diaminobutyrate--2-oxoglutarate transaminase [Bacillus sp. mrc49]